MEEAPLTLLPNDRVFQVHAFFFMRGEKKSCLCMSRVLHLMPSSGDGRTGRQRSRAGTSHYSLTEGVCFVGDEDAGRSGTFKPSSER